MAFNDYELIEELGRGTMGVVFLARDPMLDRFVAIKVMSITVDTDPGYHEELIQRFLREARSLANLSHPNIVVVHELGLHRDFNEYYMVMEYIEGGTLESLIDEKGELPVNLTLKIGIQACEALYYIHNKNLLHRDIKPANMILSGNGVLKIMDFGLVRSEDMDLTRPGSVVGSALFMPFEQLSDIKNIDHRVDIYALGVTLYHLLSGRYPFEAENIYDLVKKIREGDFIPLSKARPGISPELEKIIHKAIAVDRNNRFRNMFEFQQALSAFNDKTINTVISPYGYDLKIKDFPSLKPELIGITDRKSPLLHRFETSESLIIKADNSFISKIISFSDKKSNETEKFSLVAGTETFKLNISGVIRNIKLILSNLKKESEIITREISQLQKSYNATKGKPQAESVLKAIEYKKLKAEKYKRETDLFSTKLKIYEELHLSIENRKGTVEFIRNLNLSENMFLSAKISTFKHESTKQWLNHFIQLNSYYKKAALLISNSRRFTSHFEKRSELLREEIHSSGRITGSGKDEIVAELSEDLNKETFIEIDTENDIKFGRCSILFHHNKQVPKAPKGSSVQIKTSLMEPLAEKDGKYRFFKSSKRLYRKEFFYDEIQCLTATTESLEAVNKSLSRGFNSFIKNLYQVLEGNHSLTSAELKNLQKAVPEIKEALISISAELEKPVNKTFLEEMDAVLLNRILGYLENKAKVSGHKF